MKSNNIKRIITKIVGTIIFICVFYFLFFSVRINPVNHHKPFYYENQLYYMIFGNIYTNGEKIEIPKKARITDFVIKDGNYYHIEYVNHFSKLIKYNPVLEERTQLSNDGESVTYIDIQDNEIVFMVFNNHINEFGFGYYKGHKQIINLIGKNPVFNNDKVYSIKDGNLFVQNIEITEEDLIILSPATQIVSSGYYEEFRILNGNIISLRKIGKSPELYVSSLKNPQKHRRLTYDSLITLRRGFKKDLIAYMKNGRTYVSYSQRVNVIRFGAYYTAFRIKEIDVSAKLFNNK